MKALACALVLLAGGGCGIPVPANGVQACAPPPATRRCPEGYACQADNRCWKRGTGPTDGDGGRPEVVVRDGPAFEVHQFTTTPSNRAVVPGGSTASSTRYRVIKTSGRSPGASGVMESPRYRYVGGLVGATQR
jgi:hypothetical protein